MIVLDTNVISELIRQVPDDRVVTWLDSFPVGDVFITAVTAAELQYGVARLPDGRRKTTLMTTVAELLAEEFHDQVLPFGVHAAAHYVDIAAARERQGLPISMADAQIAAICRCHDAELATRNVKDFADTGVSVRDPWNAGL